MSGAITLYWETSYHQRDSRSAKFVRPLE